MSKIDRTGPKMGFRSPKGEKSVIKRIEQPQKASKKRILKNGDIRGFLRGFLSTLVLRDECKLIFIINKSLKSKNQPYILYILKLIKKKLINYWK